MIIECSCGEQASYDELETQCPNDIISQCPGWSQNEEGKWVCHRCQSGPDLRPAKEKYPFIIFPELYQISLEIANDACKEINKRAKEVESYSPTPAQFILEELIKILEQRQSASQ